MTDDTTPTEALEWALANTPGGAEALARAEVERLRLLCRRAGERLRAKARRDNVAPDPEMGWWHPDGDLIEALEEAGR